MTKAPLITVVMLGLLGCSEARRSYQPASVEQFELISEVRRTSSAQEDAPTREYTARLEVRLPEGYVREGRSDFEYSWSRKDDPIHFVVETTRTPARSASGQAEPCQSFGPGHPSATHVTKALVHEQGPDGSELEMCVQEEQKGGGKARPLAYSVRKRIPIHDRWIECRAIALFTHRSESSSPSGLNRAQGDQLLEVCRSLRMASFAPTQSYGPATAQRFEVALRASRAQPRTAVLEMSVPPNYSMELIQRWPLWRRGGNPVVFYVNGYARVSGDVAAFDPSRCPPPEGNHGEAAVSKQLLREQAPDGSVVLVCEIEVQRGTSQRGPAAYSIHKRIPVEDSWIECEVELQGTLADGYRDANHWGETERTEIAEVCRSLRLLSIENRANDSVPRFR